MSTKCRPNVDQLSTKRRLNDNYVTTTRLRGKPLRLARRPLSTMLADDVLFEMAGDTPIVMSSTFSRYLSSFEGGWLRCYMISSTSVPISAPRGSHPDTARCRAWAVAENRTKVDARASIVAKRGLLATQRVVEQGPVLNIAPKWRSGPQPLQGGVSSHGVGLNIGRIGIEQVGRIGRLGNETNLAMALPGLLSRNLCHVDRSPVGQATTVD